VFCPPEAEFKPATWRVLHTNSSQTRHMARIYSGDTILNSAHREAGIKYRVPGIVAFTLSVPNLSEFGKKFYLLTQNLEVTQGCVCACQTLFIDINTSFFTVQFRADSHLAGQTQQPGKYRNVEGAASCREYQEEPE
jgi:hypothetical protein